MFNKEMKSKETSTTKTINCDEHDFSSEELLK